MSTPAGYELRITSWENDGDNYKTNIVNGLTKEQVEFYVTFIKIYQDSGYDNRFDENLDEGEAQNLVDKMMNVYEGKTHNLHSLFAKYLPQNITEETYEGEVEDLISTLTGYGEFSLRVISSYEIYFIPVDLVDLSDQFPPLEH